MEKSEDDKDDYNSSQPKLPDLNLPPPETSESPQTISGTPAKRLSIPHIGWEYLKLVKETLQDKMELYNEFVNVMKYFQRERFDLPYVIQRMKELFKEHPQLILQYNIFVQKQFRIPLPTEDAPELAKQPNPNAGDTFFSKAQGTRHKRHSSDNNVQQQRNNVPLNKCAAQRFYQDAEGTGNSGISPILSTYDEEEEVGQSMPLYSSDEYKQKSMKKLDLSNCESCTPSYRILPENYASPSASQRTDIGAEVLNDHCVLVRSEKFKHVQKNQYEDVLFLCEDDRSELDTWLELVDSTIVRIQELLGKIGDNDISSDHPFRIEDYLKAPYLKCIKSLYGEHWLYFMDKLRENASLALSVILSRLKQKQVEWKSSQAVCSKGWAETLAKYFHKSLDHRSCYFKEQDSKSLSTKALVFQIKEISEKQQFKNDTLESIVSRSRQPIIPHMEFEFPDPEIHADLYRLIKFSCEEICSSEQADNLMKIWTTFLEPVMGVPHRPQGAGDTGRDRVIEQALSSGGSAISSEKYYDVSGNGHDLTFQPFAASQGDVCTKAIPSSNKKLPQCTGSLHRGEWSMTHLEVETMKENLSPYRDDELEELKVCSSGSIETTSYTEDYSANRQLGIAYREGMVGDAGHVAYNDYVESALGISQKASQSVDFSGSDLVDCSSTKPDGEGDGGQMSTRPLNELVPLASHEEDKKGLTLYERIRKAKLYSSAENRSRGSNHTNPTDSYERLMSAIYHFLNGSSGHVEFEDDCRSIIGTHSYLLCTLDELVYKVVKQLRKIARDETDMGFIQLHAYEKSRNPASYTDVIYSENARFMLPDDDIYRIECVCHGSRLTIQLVDYVNDELVDYGNDEPEHITNSVDDQFTAYLNNDLLSVVPEETETRGIYLKRNKRIHARGDESDAQLEALEGVIIVNALDIKISTLTSKATYMKHTEDFMYRRKKRRAILYRSVSNARSAKGIPVQKRHCRLFS